jgi:hypothetical protein
LKLKTHRDNPMMNLTVGMDSISVEATESFRTTDATWCVCIENRTTDATWYVCIENSRDDTERVVMDFIVTGMLSKSIE